MKLENKLTKNNINEVIDKYLECLKEINMNEFMEKMSKLNILDYLTYLKRDSFNKGPYPDVSIFEASNRIMTDMVILNGISILLEGRYPNINFSEYIVEYGNDRNLEHDINAKENGYILHGEAFNVAPSFFQSKKTKALAKLRKNMIDNKTISILLFNKDSVNIKYKPKLKNSEYFIPVEINVKI
ncbi:conserved hypothetical protein [Treponema primitia ZAS-2]|uniref:Uncharacterized protein n=1 Tax=Treponema primitia (strain ATCC BAA-887 / DSM 12427 / ZAS-2) TaxID=545694 RepID=F5YJU8_TREPZ|nr:hypothetical protein [Treponema primitia]AEF84092.1 conserved hypothetical protein [Treponema primitia ZAS-2]